MSLTQVSATDSNSRGSGPAVLSRPPPLARQYGTAQGNKPATTLRTSYEASETVEEELSLPKCVWLWEREGPGGVDGVV